MATARQIITKAMQKLGAITKSDTPSSDEIVDGLSALLGMLSSWSVSGLNVYARALESFPFVPSQGVYTIGTGGDFNTDRPTQIISAYFRDGQIDYPLMIIDDQTFAQISFKGEISIPLYINYTNSYPLGQIRVYPVPSSQYTLFLLSEKPFSEYTIDEEVDLPPGWERAIIYNLALELAPDFGQPASPELVGIANRAMANIQTQIDRVQGIDFDNSVGVRGNIYNGWFLR